MIRETGPNLTRMGDVFAAGSRDTRSANLNRLPIVGGELRQSASATACFKRRFPGTQSTTTGDCQKPPRVIDLSRNVAGPLGGPFFACCTRLNVSLAFAALKKKPAGALPAGFGILPGRLVSLRLSWLLPWQAPPGRNCSRHSCRTSCRPWPEPRIVLPELRFAVRPWSKPRGSSTTCRYPGS